MMSLDHKPWGEEMIYLKFEVAEYNQISTELDIVVFYDLPPVEKDTYLGIRRHW